MFRSILTPRVHVACGVAIAIVCAAGPAAAQTNAASGSRACGSRASWSELFTGTLDGFRNLPSRDSARLLAFGGVAAAGVHALDHEVNESSPASAVRTTFRAGTVVGATPFELGAAIATYGIGRASNNGCLARLGADLFGAQVMAETLTFGLKQATRRARPEGSGYSFPSGHTTVSFASATVLERHFGWKVGIPAYAVAAYVGASRVENKRHFVSDVIFGAALGIAAGRSMTMGIGPNRRLALTPVPLPGGGAALFTLK
jgi:membrane-associated phospholipid phosphatase